jgi:hypothetical protein
MFDPNDDAQRGQQTDSHVTHDGALTRPRELISWTNQPGSGHRHYGSGRYGWQSKSAGVVLKK